MSEVNNVDFGSIKIHKNVLAELTFSALKDVYGVTPIPKDWTAALYELIGRKHYPGISILVDHDGKVTVDAQIHVQYGLNIPTVAKEAQDAIRETIEKSVEIDLKDVNVNVQGIERGTQ